MMKIERMGKRYVALFLAAAMLVAGLPVFPVSAEEETEVTAEAAAAAVAALTCFKGEDLSTYNKYLTALKNNETHASEYSRVNNAVAVLDSDNDGTANVDFYDDFQVFGTYKQKSETADVDGNSETGDGGREATVGVEPENAGAIFPTNINTTNYEIVWGGLKAQREAGKSETWPSVYSSTAGLTFDSFHINQYTTLDGKGRQINLTGNDMTSDQFPSYIGFEEVWDRYNCVTLKEDIMNGNRIDRIAGEITLGQRSVFIMYNYIDQDNWAAWGCGGGGNWGLIWIECRAGILYPNPIDDSNMMENNAGWLLSWGDLNAINARNGSKINYEMAWDQANSCYKLTLTGKNQSGNVATKEVLLNGMKSNQQVGKLGGVEN